jgi:hypothetical protein
MAGPRLLLLCALLGVFVTDATVTLLRRLARGDAVFSAHRAHAYQRANPRDPRPRCRARWPLRTRPASSLVAAGGPYPSGPARGGEAGRVPENGLIPQPHSAALPHSVRTHAGKLAKRPRPAAAGPRVSTGGPTRERPSAARARTCCGRFVVWRGGTARTARGVQRNSRTCSNFDNVLTGEYRNQNGRCPDSLRA